MAERLQEVCRAATRSAGCFARALRAANGEARAVCRSSEGRRIDAIVSVTQTRPAWTDSVRMEKEDLGLVTVRW